MFRKAAIGYSLSAGETWQAQPDSVDEDTGSEEAELAVLTCRFLSSKDNIRYMNINIYIIHNHTIIVNFNIYRTYIYIYIHICIGLKTVSFINYIAHAIDLFLG